MKTVYGKFTWPEIKAVDKDRVVLLPVGAMEDHGPHLPLDTDNLMVTRLAEAAAASIPDEVLLLPTIPFGFNEHHKDFPGVIYIQPETLMHFVVDVTRSLVHHGFRRILILNGHGSNHPVLDLAARKTVIETECLCVSVSYWNLIADTLRAERRSPTGGMAHAGELETSLYLYFDPQHVQLDQARAAVVHDDGSRYFCLDLAGGAKAMVMQWWSAQTADGTMGDPTVADAGRGKLFFEAAVEETVGLIQEIRQMRIHSRRDHH
ncbi:MAG: creatininase family protein [Desulfobacterales bacterium]|nr:MAG: creatininase family protein [Desulfobacterales bacterium]